MGMAIAAFRLGLATRLMPFAGVVIATVLTVWPEYQRLAPYLGNAPLFDVVRALNLSAVQAVAVGLIATVASLCVVSRVPACRAPGPSGPGGGSHGDVPFIHLPLRCRCGSDQFGIIGGAVSTGKWRAVSS
jgi:hypothetical protein